MKRWLPWIIVGVFAAWVVAGLREPKVEDGFHTNEFSELPVLLNGRVQPMDSVARNSLLLIRTKSSVHVDPEAESVTLTNNLVRMSEDLAGHRGTVQQLKEASDASSSETYTNALNSMAVLWQRIANAREVAALHVPAAVEPLNAGREAVADAIRAMHNGDFADADARQTAAISKLDEGRSVVAARLDGLKSYKLSAIEWMLEVMFKPEVADNRRIFQIHHPELLSQLELDTARKYFSFNEIFNRRGPEGENTNFDWLRGQGGRLGEIERELWTPLDKQIGLLNQRMQTYLRLKSSIQPEGTQDFAGELENFQVALMNGMAAFRARQAGQEFDRQSLQILASLMQRYEALERMALPMVLPPMNPEEKPDGWINIGAALKEPLDNGGIHPAATYYAKMASAYHAGEPSAFNSALSEYHRWVDDKGLHKAVKKGRQEAFFNHYAPFYKCMVLYVAALLLACGFWLNWTPWMRQAAFLLIGLAFIIHTSGLIFRMYLEGRPPVTNLYSSAIFIGWASVGLGAILERIYKDGVGIVVASFVGFITLIIAHHLSLSGDTMEMLRAVLDTNFWLATHVVCITIGYSAMFVAGFLAIIYIVRGVLTRSLGADTGKAIARMVYGIICFATLFSFVGTILGGIWADQSWGRFWGWDPKENGALMIVLWCAIVLHARWGGLIRERGLMAMAVFGNIVTAFSWFGVNMLGIGLHSYGFMDAAFKWLMGFNASQLLLIALALLPLEMWKSFKHLPRPAGPSKDGGETTGGSLPEPAKA